MNGLNADTGLGRDRRLLQSRQFRETFDQEDSIAGRYMVIWVRRAADAALRVGVVASSRTFPRAVDRNKAKRRLREAFRLNRQFIVKPEADFVIIARRVILKAEQTAVGAELLSLVRAKGIEVVADK